MSKENLDREKWEELIVFREFLSEEERKKVNDSIKKSKKFRALVTEEEKLRDLLLHWSDSFHTEKEFVLISWTKVLIGSFLFAIFIFSFLRFALIPFSVPPQPMGKFITLKEIAMTPFNYPNREAISFGVLPEDVTGEFGEELYSVAWETYIPAKNLIEVEVKR